jgi:uncharacterized membrane protein YebE (DUF533 family)
MAETPTKDRPALSQSQFYMWRCVIALAHADGHVQEEERAYLQRIIAGLDRRHGLSAEQKKVFETDMAQPQDVAALLPHVTDPQFRGQLIDFGRMLVWADGKLTPDEETVLQKLHGDLVGKLDVDGLRTEVRRELAAREKEYAAEKDKTRAESRKKNPVAGALDRLMMKLGYDILD